MSGIAPAVYSGHLVTAGQMQRSASSCTHDVALEKSLFIPMLTSSFVAGVPLLIRHAHWGTPSRGGPPNEPGRLLRLIFEILAEKGKSDLTPHFSVLCQKNGTPRSMIAC